MKSFKGHLNPRKKPDPKARKLLYQMFQSQSFSKTTVQDFTWADRQIHTRPSDNTKHATGHGTTLQRDKIQLHHQKTGTNPPVRIPSHDSGPTSLMEVNSTIRRNSNCPACRKEDPRHRNLNRLKRQRNMLQMKECSKILQDQTNEQETGHLPAKEFTVVIE